mmetsp:Transcript_3389/g.12686  ORF Transcript_3389/g.12686 Transcript_3389/m.12686 type:complete len:202 (+) Transcript_3389:185-790(+)
MLARLLASTPHCPKGMSSHLPGPLVNIRRPLQSFPCWRATSKPCTSACAWPAPFFFHEATVRSMGGNTAPKSAACGMCGISLTKRTAVVQLPFGTRRLTSAMYCSMVSLPRKLSCPPMSRKVTAPSGHCTAVGKLIAQPPLMTTAGGVRAPKVCHKVGSTTWPPREPKMRRSLRSTIPSSISCLAHVCKFWPAQPLGKQAG